MDYISWIRSKVEHDKVFLNFAVALLRNSEGRILAKSWGDSGLWGFVGGCIQLGESFEEALQREIFKETGFKEIKILKQLGAYNFFQHRYPNGDAVQDIDIVYVCQVLENFDLSGKNTERLKLKWLTVEEFADLPLKVEGHRQVLRDYLDWMKKK